MLSNSMTIKPKALNFCVPLLTYFGTEVLHGDDSVIVFDVLSQFCG